VVVDSQNNRFAFLVIIGINRVLLPFYSLFNDEIVGVYHRVRIGTIDLLGLAEDLCDHRLPLLCILDMMHAEAEESQRRFDNARVYERIRVGRLKLFNGHPGVEVVGVEISDMVSEGCLVFAQRCRTCSRKPRFPSADVLQGIL